MGSRLYGHILIMFLFACGCASGQLNYRILTDKMYVLYSIQNGDTTLCVRYIIGNFKTPKEEVPKVIEEIFTSKDIAVDYPTYIWFLKDSFCNTESYLEFDPAALMTCSREKDGVSRALVQGDSIIRIEYFDD